MERFVFGASCADPGAPHWATVAAFGIAARLDCPEHVWPAGLAALPVVWPSTPLSHPALLTLESG